MTKLQKKGRLPLYHQLIEIITNDIESGKLKENDKLPSEREYCEFYDISRATVRQAIKELENNGFLYKMHGKGSFVAARAFEQHLLSFYSFTDEMIKLGKVPTSHLLSFDIMQSSEKVARKLAVEEGTEVYQIVRLRLADDECMVYERTYLPKRRFDGLREEWFVNRSMYEIFRSEYNVKFTKAEERFRPVLMKEYIADLLSVDSKIPSMRIERLTFEREQIIEYTVGHARGDRFEYHVVLGND